MSAIRFTSDLRAIRLGSVCDEGLVRFHEALGFTRLTAMAVRDGAALSAPERPRTPRNVEATRHDEC